VEKRKPSFALDVFKAVAGDPARLRMTSTASLSAAALGLEPNDVAEVVRSMKMAQFHKSMTSYVDHRRWKVVYYVPWKETMLYVKFTDDTITEFIVLSFKER
jgi:motility quorum-sensing regulator/GCU-specific mRNA interferase toxin